MTDQEKDNMAKTLSRGLDILEMIALSENQNGLTLNEILDQINLPRSNIYRYLTTLHRLGWLDRDDETFRYRVGIKPFIVGKAFLADRSLREKAQPIMTALASGKFLSVHLGVPDNNTIVYLEKIDGNNPIQMRSRPGMKVPCHSTAMGKAYLATLPQDSALSILQGPLEKRTPSTITSIEEILSELQSIQLSGYSIDREENEIGIGCVAAPIFGSDQKLAALISVSSLISEFNENEIPGFGDRISNAARNISENIGCYAYQSAWKKCLK